jgi:hypothetical protein
MKDLSAIIPSKFIFILFLFCACFINAQENSEILDLYEDYTKEVREVVYMHLNKSTYIKGESIGFTAYVLDKKSKKRSKLTTNLYVNIEDANKTILNQKLLKVQDGIASNIIEIDSSFTSGYYTIKAYTSWMLNFNEQNYYTESIRIIDPETEQFVEEKRIENEIDAQFLPESGHLLNGVINNIGVVIKDNLGFGIPNAKGEILDKNNKILTSFETNQFGIGKFQLLADIDNTYSATIKNDNKEFTFNLNQNIENKGIIISLNILKSKVFVSIITNTETLETIKNKRYSLMIHNGNNYNIMDLYFTDQTVVTKSIDFKNTASGVNILTLFNENNQPIAERLFFNYEGIKILTSDDISAIKAKDSVTLNLSFKSIDPTAFNSLSISVLPKETKSYKRHNNLLSYSFLQPYINGPVEQAKYYFTNITTKKQYELDNLLLTQGWSSYNWDTIFNEKLNENYAFEQGIRLKANIHSSFKSAESTYMLYTSNTKEPYFFNIKHREQNYFYIDSLFPERSEKLYLSTFDKKDIVQPPKIYLQASPVEIPKLFYVNPILNPKEDYSLISTLNQNSLEFRNINNIQELDEVVLEGEINKKKLRIEALSKNNRGRITIIEDQEIVKHMILSRFLNTKGFKATENYASQTLSVLNTSSFLDPPLLFVNDFLASPHELYQYPMYNIDYIAIDMGSSIPQRSNGEIRIYTYPGSRIEDNRKKNIEFKFPLTFETKKTYYAPIYSHYNDDFYKAYGTVEWKPELITDKDGNISVKIAQPEVPITLFIEGIANNGAFIFEEKTISLN